MKSTKAVSKPDAMQDPRPGDEWALEDELREVLNCDGETVQVCIFDRYRRGEILGCFPKTFRRWASGAQLVARKEN